VIWSANRLIQKSANSNLQKSTSSNSKQIQQTQNSEAKNQTNQTDELQQVSQQVRQLGGAKDLFGLLKLKDDVNLNQSEKNIAVYTEMMIKICGALNSYDFDNNKQYLLSRQCAKNALRKLDQMPIGRATQLVALLGGDNEYLLGVLAESDWANDRTERMYFWCRAWQQLEDEIDENFDFESNRPVYSPQMTTEERKKAEKYNQQRFLQRDKKDFLVDFQRFLVDAYSKPPYNMSELEHYLKKCVTNTELKKTILTKVQQRIVENEKNK
jgi:hypothetical protein